MQDLTVIEILDDSLIAVDAGGTRFRISVDDEVRSRLRRNKSEADDGARISPREVQFHIRSGLSAAEVAELTGASLSYVERFEGPIIAEREHIVASALSVPVRHASDIDEDDSFGAVIRQRLVSVGAVKERWISWKDPESGWVIKLTFTADDIDHDARWSFDPRTQVLDPVNAEAITLSQEGELRDGLIPRLRAVTATAPVDTTRFDSGAFVLDDELDKSPLAESRPASPVSNSVSVSAIKRSRESGSEQNHTADLLEALRRRRGERESAALPHETSDDDRYERDGNEREHGGMRLVDLPLDPFDDETSATHEPSVEQARPTTDRSGKRGRASIPSWDDIVFGARSDDD